MSRLLCVANWSEGRNEETLALMRAPLKAHGLERHFDGADPDHNRIVTAFSGSVEQVLDCLYAIAEVAFERIDMRKHAGVHPRIGALDVCPFIVLSDSMSVETAKALAKGVADEIAERYHLPVFLYEKNESGKHAADLPSLRKGQYEELFVRDLDADFGPRKANLRLGACVVGVRDWLIAMNVNLETEDISIAKRIAREMRSLRDSGDHRFAGVRALGLPLASRQRSQVSMNLTQPDSVSPDEIIDWISRAANVPSETELIGVIRPQDLPKSTSLKPLPEQVVQP